ncbi:MAG: type IV toxin-antitoxin system AbiEi family antitoxin [Cyclobacteriaceae bacterium]|nr:type IV toxin-antitoxin system AbiEi family antitoxin [Cyclobacteriaceae bacterium]
MSDSKLFIKFERSGIPEHIKILNMTEPEIIYKALEKLNNNLKIRGKWKKTHYTKLDGQLDLIIDKTRLQFNVEIKQELKSHLLPQILRYHKDHQPFILVAGRLYPKMKEQLRQYNISYIESNGNIFLKNENMWLFIDSYPPLEINEEKKGRSFTKSGVRFIYELLHNPEMINKSYRIIAQETQISVGNITNIIHSLKRNGFIINLDDKNMILVNKEKLVEKWTEAYENSLKPTLKIGTFRFINQNDYVNWKKIQLNKESACWGGEPAADLLTNYLHPEKFILYTTETYEQLIKNYKLIPDEKGKVCAYQKFWNSGEVIPLAAPPLITYADLVHSENPRCIETAHKIYEQYLKPIP